MKIEVSSEIRTACPAFAGVAISAKVVNTAYNEELWKKINEFTVRYREMYTTDSIKDMTTIHATREAYKKCGKDPSRYRPSGEALCRRILRGISLYQIDTLVDLINLVSIRFGYSIGGFDADKIVGDALVLGIGKAGEPYEGIGRGELNIEGMPVYRDAVGGIGTPTSDNERTKLELGTTHLLAIINGYSGKEGLRDAADYMIELLKEFASAEDITQGLPRVEELFEARKPKSLAIISEIDGEVRFEEIKNARHAVIFNTETGEEKQYLIPFGFRVKVQEGQIIKKGDKITDGAVNPHDILAILGSDAVMNYLISEVQSTYRLQGVEINDKHIEVIVRQMMRKVRVDDAGDTKFMSGQTYDKNDVLFENEQIKKRIANGEENLREATFTQLLLGITKAALATDSFLSAASFQETTRVLTDAAIKGKVDPLIGLKENVIIGKVIPAGTGMPRYAGVKLDEPKPEVEDTQENEVESTEQTEIAE